MYGMFGLGKTQLALKYATGRITEPILPFFWISARCGELNQGLAKVLDLIDHQTVTM